MKPAPHPAGPQFLQTFRRWKPLEWDTKIAPAEAGEVVLLILTIPGSHAPAAAPSEYLGAIPESAAVSRDQWLEFLGGAHTAKIWFHPLIGNLLEIRASYATAFGIAGALCEPWIKIASKRGFAESAAALEDDVLDEFCTHRISTK